MPINAIMKTQSAIVIILIIAFGGKDAAEFFTLLVLMTNVAMIIAYVFLSVAFPSFKKKQLDGYVEKPFVIYKSYGISLLASIIVSIVVGFANVFTIIEPALNGQMYKTVAMILGPVIFSIIGFVLYYLYEKKYLSK